MYKGDFARKSTLSKYGFRLPSCLDNRPLKFEEWENFRPQTIFVSATPGPWELEQTAGVFSEQVVRPTGRLILTASSDQQLIRWMTSLPNAARLQQTASAP